MAGGIVAGLLVILLITMSQRAPVQTAAVGDVNAEQARLSDAPSPVAATPVPPPTETAPPPTPEVQHKKAPPPPQAETKPATTTEPTMAAERPKEEPVEEAPARPRDLFPSSGVSPLSHFVDGPDGQEGKANEIVRVAVDSLKITRSGNGKTGYNLVLRKTKILKGKMYGENVTETLTLGAAHGDPMKEFGLDPATATGKTLVLFLKNEEGETGRFSFFGLTGEDYDRLTSRVTAEARPSAAAKLSE